tara:strand:+ start:524 stop:802 length:279 start_codon:yes stop_codon:yes gene_type:complete
MSRTISAKSKVKFTNISKEDLKRAKKVMFVHTYGVSYERLKFLPITVSKKDIKVLMSEMDEGLVLEGNMFETGYLPLSIFIFRMTNKGEKQQ